MGKGEPSERNVVNDDKNWRLRIKEETMSQRHFESEWGFLLPDYARRDAAESGPTEVKRTKYFDLKRGPTVIEKRVPAANRVSAEDEAGLDPKSAAVVATSTHEELMRSIPKNPAFMTTSQKAYGARRSLEQFGVSDFGMKSVIKSAGIAIKDGEQGWQTRLGYEDQWDEDED
jgi:hypothetical protein